MLLINITSVKRIAINMALGDQETEYRIGL